MFDKIPGHNLFALETVFFLRVCHCDWNNPGWDESVNSIKERVMAVTRPPGGK